MHAVLCFQFHTHRSLRHSKASRYFQTVAELRLSVYDLCPSKPRPFVQIEAEASAHAQIFTAWRYTFKNQGFKLVFFLAVSVFGSRSAWPAALGPLMGWRKRERWKRLDANPSSRTDTQLGRSKGQVERNRQQKQQQWWDLLVKALRTPTHQNQVLRVKSQHGWSLLLPYGV